MKAKNFLVLQGDVEAVASQSPKELARLIDQISGELELAPDYEKAREALERATENATFNFTKRRGIAGEIKQYKEQKGEAERFEALCQERVRCFCDISVPCVIAEACYRTSSCSVASCSSSTTFSTPSRSMPGLSRSRTRRSQASARSSASTRRALEDARAEQARARSNVMQKEKRIKKAEKALETKVRPCRKTIASRMILNIHTVPRLSSNRGADQARRAEAREGTAGAREAPADRSRAAEKAAGATGEPADGAESGERGAR